jgi:hypothetical protein
MIDQHIIQRAEQAFILRIVAHRCATEGGDVLS